MESDSPVSSALAHRNEIDGLRALAVLVVIVFHAGIGFLPGGFLGVDVFFVISGYLIASIAMKDIAAKRFSLVDFLERRLRRVFPALFFLCLLCLLPAWFLLPPSEYKDFVESLLANVLAVANYLFLSQSGYFDQAAEMKPLLHTWSLSIELQFYLLVAVVIAVIMKFQLKVGVAAVYLCLLLSFSLYVYLFYHNRDASFYIFPVRLWEFMVGILTALVIARGSFCGEKLNILLSALGVFCILFTVVFYQVLVSNQIIATALVVVGTGLVLAFTHSGSCIARILSLRYLAFIGVISYSLYLYHNPILSFARYLDLHDDFVFLLSAFIAMLLLSYLSWRFIENPFRDKRKVSTRSFRRIYIGSFIFFALFLAVADHTKGLMYYRLTDVQQTMLLSAVSQSAPNKRCQAGSSNEISPADACVLNGENPRWVVFGDSHAGAAALALADEVSAHNEGATLWLSRQGCIPGYVMDPVSACEVWIDRVVKLLADTPNLETVIVLARFNTYLFGSQVGVYPGLGEGPGIEGRERIWSRYQALIQKFLDAGKEVVVVTPIPEPRRRAADLIFMEGQDQVTIYSAKRSWWDYRNAFALGKMKSLPAEVKLYSPESVFCDADLCYAVKDMQAYYHDHNHVSTIGAKKFAQGFAQFYWEEK